MNFLRKLRNGRGAPTTRSLPEGLAVIAFGDVHGRYDLLTELHVRAASALARLRPANSIEIFLGDYVDRGPDSRRVVEWLMTSPRICDERICLRGNHEAMLLAALDSPAIMPQWLRNGGLETMRSYGVDVEADPSPAVLQAAFRRQFPIMHRMFLEGLRDTAVFGTYLFVHAGIMPGKKLHEQDPEDLIWIRDPFLGSAADFGHIVVHGHTPLRGPELRPNRINIDTGAFYSGRLTCAIMHGSDVDFLAT
jgi:serine/threonine protein phosphatase 1